MFAALPVIVQVATGIITNLPALIQAGKDVSVQIGDLRRLFSDKPITLDELAVIRARNDALNAEIESQTETGQG